MIMLKMLCDVVSLLEWVFDFSCVIFVVYIMMNEEVYVLMVKFLILEVDEEEVENEISVSEMDSDELKKDDDDEDVDELFVQFVYCFLYFGGFNIL